MGILVASTTGHGCRHYPPPPARSNSIDTLHCYQTRNCRYYSISRGGGGCGRRGRGWGGPSTRRPRGSPALPSRLRHTEPDRPSTALHYTVMQAWSAPYGLTGSVCPNWLAKPNRLAKSNRLQDHLPDNGARLARFRASSHRYSSQTRTVTLGGGPVNEKRAGQAPDTFP